LSSYRSIGEPERHNGAILGLFWAHIGLRYQGCQSYMLYLTVECEPSTAATTSVMSHVRSRPLPPLPTRRATSRASTRVSVLNSPHLISVSAELPRHTVVGRLTKAYGAAVGWGGEGKGRCGEGEAGNRAAAPRPERCAPDSLTCVGCQTKSDPRRPLANFPAAPCWRAHTAPCIGPLSKSPRSARAGMQVPRT
jgi:hypothetical protein